jgi:hypothetical protein
MFSLALKDFPPKTRKALHQNLTEQYKREQIAKGIPEKYAAANIPSIAALRATAKEPLKGLPENVERTIGEFLGQMPSESASGKKHYPSRNEIVKSIASIRKAEHAAKKEQERLEKIRVAMEEFKKAQEMKETSEMLQRKAQKEKSRTRRGKNYNFRSQKKQNTYVVRKTRKA